jgi:type IV pilus assembly protein PilC
MTMYQYVAKDPRGRRVKGRLEAPDQRTLGNLLRSNELSVLSITEVKGKGGGGLFGSFLGRKRAPLSELVLFSRQMATMVDAGIPLLQAIEILHEQTENRDFRAVMASVKQNVSSGSSLSQALSKQGEVFSELFINMVKAGEESGSLDEIMERLATYLEKTQRLIAKVKSAMIYPIVVCGMAVGITTLIMIKVIPVFKEMYQDFGAPLPTPTLALIAISDFLVANLGLLSGAMGTTVFLIARFARTRAGTQLFDRLKLRLPIFGPLLKKVAIGKFSRTLSTLVKSGVPILAALEITSKTAGNKVIEEAVLKVRGAIRTGENITEPLKSAKVFPPMVVRMIAIGEKTGELEKMLNKIADFYEEQVELAIAGLTSILEPLIILFLGVVIGGIVICMFLPIFSLAKIVSG